jgi:hypothetical protein
VWLLPVLTLLAYGIAGGATLPSHQIVYRSFDFAYVSLAMGIAFTVASLKHRPRRQLGVIGLTLTLALMTFPFGYMTDTLEGIRHDSQQYEVDALTWVHTHEGDDAVIQSDERISYDGLALFDFAKRPYVPDYLTSGTYPSDSTLSLFLEEWTLIGVNHYPFGHVTIDQQASLQAIDASDALYVGGPADNNLIIFRSSEAAQSILA